MQARSSGSGCASCAASGARVNGSVGDVSRWRVSVVRSITARESGSTCRARMPCCDPVPRPTQLTGDVSDAWAQGTTDIRTRMWMYGVIREWVIQARGKDRGKRFLKVGRISHAALVYKVQSFKRPHSARHTERNSQRLHTLRPVGTPGDRCVISRSSGSKHWSSFWVNPSAVRKNHKIAIGGTRTESRALRLRHRWYHARLLMQLSMSALDAHHRVRHRRHEDRVQELLRRVVVAAAAGKPRACPGLQSLTLGAALARGAAAAPAAPAGCAFRSLLHARAKSCSTAMNPQSGPSKQRMRSTQPM